MAELKATIFNVERGLCVFIRTPNDYGVMIDCGCGSTFSPVKWLIDHEAANLQSWNGKKLAYLIVTHPHDDHVEDIHNLTALFPPAILNRNSGFNWNVILHPPDGDPSENTTEYYQWQQAYNQPALEYPNYGVSFYTGSLSPTEAAEIDANTQHLLNNSSIVTVATYPIAGHTWKIVIAGDNETKAWEKLLERESFREAIKGANFFITSHHGHNSGFCSSLFDAMGMPYLNISSERTGDASVCDSYGSYATGLDVGGVKRYHLTTRKEGCITIHMTDQWKYTIDCQNLCN